MRYPRISPQKIAYIKQLAPHTHTDIIVKKVGVCKSTVNKYIAMMGDKIISQRQEWRNTRKQQAFAVMIAKKRKNTAAKQIGPKSRPSAEYSNDGYLATLKKYECHETH